MDNQLELFNEKYAIEGHVAFRAGAGGLVTAQIDNAHASAAVTLAGGHMMAYTPRGQKPVLWESPNSAHEIGRAMRGGVPVCWPWFGPHPEDPQHKPMHGLVRTMLWTLAGTRALPDGSTEVRVLVRDRPATRAVWPHAFELELVATVGQRLVVEWIARNPGDAPYTYSGALHPYFAVADVGQAAVHGLDGVDYLDKNDAYRRKTQHGPVKFSGPVDCIFLDTAGDLVVADIGSQRAVRISKRGSRTSVVWNPSANDANMPDVGAGQHRFFLCAEAANAVDDLVTVPPGGEGRLAMEMRVEALVPL